MNINQYIDKVSETKCLQELNELLDNNGVIINTYVKRVVDDTVYETLWYSVGRVNMGREFSK